jgi:type I site-specific restriction endonuclease
MMQIREEVAFTKEQLIVRGKIVSRGKAKRADYIHYYKPTIPTTRWSNRDPRTLRSGSAWRR